MSTLGKDSVYPYLYKFDMYPNFSKIERRIEEGLTKREYFASMVLQALISHRGNYQDVTSDSVNIADEFIFKLNHIKP